MKPPEIAKLDDQISTMIAITERLGNEAHSRDALENAIQQTRNLMKDRVRLINELRAEHWPDCPHRAKWSERECELAARWLPWCVRRGRLRIFRNDY